MELGWLKSYIKEEKVKISRLSGKARLQYVWDYYKLWIISFISLLAFAVYMGTIISSSIGENWFYIGYVNTTRDLGNQSAVWMEYVDYTGYDLKEANVQFNSQLYFNYKENYARGNKYYETFVAFTEAGTLDAVTMDIDAMVMIGESGRLLDLDSDACASIREKYGNRFIYCTPQDKEYGEHVAVAIDITDSRLMKEYHIYPEGDTCALGIGFHSQHIDAVEKYLDMIFMQ